MTPDNRNDLGKILKQQRLMIPLTLKELAHASGVSTSHLGRVERGERFPSARILRKIAKPLGFAESELFSQAGFLSPKPAVVEGEGEHNVGQLDPYVQKMLSQEPIEMQRTVIGILSVLKNIANGCQCNSV